MWLLIAIGIAAALGTLASGRRLSGHAEQRLYVTILFVMQALYLAFVFVAPSGRGFLVESTVLLVFWALAAGGSRLSWILPVGYVLHGLWDLFHGARVTAYVPSGYPELCLAYDWIVALYLATRLRAWRRP